jgi:hypothetical protein
VNPSLTNDEILELATVFVRSNTPRYFFDQLRATDAVQRISELCTASDIKQALSELQPLNTDDPETMLSMYALLMALAQKTNASAPDYFKSLDISHFRWGAHFMRLLIQNSRSDNRITLFGPTHSINPPATVHATASTQSIAFTAK